MAFDGVNPADVTADLEATPAAAEVTPSPEDGQQQAVAATPPVEETLYEVKINGQTHKVPLSELTGGYSRQQDYTRKTTEIAEYRRQIDAEVAQYRQQIAEVQEFFKQPQVRQALQALRQPQIDPNQPATVAQTQQLLQQQLEQERQQYAQQQQQMFYELQVQNLAAGFAREIDNTLGQLKTKHPVLSDIDGVDELLRKQVASTQPQTLDDVKAAFAQAGAALASKLEARFQTQQKQTAVQQTQLKRNGIEPPGGAVVPPPAPTRMKIGSADLLHAAVADMLGGNQGQ